MKKWLIASAIVLVLLGAGAYAAYQYVLSLAAEKISSMIPDDFDIDQYLESHQNEIDQMINEHISGGGAAAEPDGPSDGGDRSAEQPPAAGSSGNAGRSSQTGNAGQNSSEDKSVSFGSKEEAMKYASSKFSASEIKEIMNIVSDGVTAEEKEMLMKKAYSRFSRAEIEALMKAMKQ